MTQKSEAQKGNITPEMEYVAEYENIDVNKLLKLIDIVGTCNNLILHVPFLPFGEEFPQIKI